MKRYIRNNTGKVAVGLIILAATMFTLLLQAQDFVKGVDFTGVSSVTASRLNNLVDLATPNSDKGLVLSTNNTPDTTAYPRYTNYIWLDRSTLPPTLKTYGTNWSAGTIGPGSITSAELAADAVISGKIAANAIWTTNLNDNIITEAKIAAGSITTTKYAAGSVDSTALGNLSVTSGKINNSAVTSDKIFTGAVTADKIAIDAVTTDKLIVNAVTATKLAAESVATTNMVTTGVNANDYLRMNSGGTAVEWGQLPSKPVYAYTNLTAVVTATTVMVLNDSIPGNTQGDEVLTIDYTPSSASSILVVEADISVTSSATSGAAIAMFVDAGASAVTSTYSQLNATQPIKMRLKYSVVSGSTASRTYRIRCGPFSGSAYVNGSGAGATPVFGATDYSTLSVTEYTP